MWNSEIDRVTRAPQRDDVTYSEEEDSDNICPFRALSTTLACVSKHFAGKIHTWGRLPSEQTVITKSTAIYNCNQASISNDDAARAIVASSTYLKNNFKDNLSGAIAQEIESVGSRGCCRGRYELSTSQQFNTFTRQRERKVNSRSRTQGRNSPKMST